LKNNEKAQRVPREMRIYSECFRARGFSSKASSILGFHFAEIRLELLAVGKVLARIAARKRMTDRDFKYLLETVGVHWRNHVPQLLRIFKRWEQRRGWEQSVDALISQMDQHIKAMDDYAKASARRKTVRR
jgi:hypothetical protein